MNKLRLTNKQRRHRVNNKMKRKMSNKAMRRAAHSPLPASAAKNT